MAEKRYYWLKLKEDFFDEKYVKALRRLPQGDSLVIVYLKMQLKSLKTEGIINYEHIVPDAVSELALLLDEDENLVKLTVEGLIRFGAIERWDNDAFYMKAMQEMIGSEGQSAERARRFRENHSEEKANIPALPPKTNAERQKAYRAKIECKAQQHIPMIEDCTNKSRYGGNYYLVTKRDGFRCKICGSVENLCVHHIDGFDETKPENNATNKMVMLCRKCHSTVHSGVSVPSDVLDDIGYYSNESVTRNVTSNSNEIACYETSNVEKEIEIEIEIEKEIEIDIDKKHICANPPSDEPKKTKSNQTKPNGFEKKDQQEKFEKFWTAYPNKKGKKTAEERWNRIKPDDLMFKRIMDGLEAQKKSREWTKDGGQFIPHPATWLNQERWNDEVTPTKSIGQNFTSSSPARDLSFLER